MSETNTMKLEDGFVVNQIKCTCPVDTQTSFPTTFSSGGAFDGSSENISEPKMSSISESIGLGIESLKVDWCKASDIELVHPVRELLKKEIIF